MNDKKVYPLTHTVYIPNRRKVTVDSQRGASVRSIIEAASWFAGNIQDLICNGGFCNLDGKLYEDARIIIIPKPQETK